jgi:hypothetical protein
VIDDDAENISSLFPDNNTTNETIQPVEFKKDKSVSLNSVSELDMD